MTKEGKKKVGKKKKPQKKMTKKNGGQKNGGKKNASELLFGLGVNCLEIQLFGLKKI